MHIKKYTLKFINNSKDKVYLRYFATVNGEGDTYDVPCYCTANKEEVQKLNSNSFGGVVQKECNRIKDALVQTINRFNVKNNTYPSPKLLKQWNTAIYSAFDIDYHTNQFYKYLRTEKKIKQSSIDTYSYTLKKFKDYFVMNLNNYSLNEMVNQQVIIDFGTWLVESRKHNSKIKQKDISKISIYNSQVVLFIYLNYIAKQFSIDAIPDFLVRPQQGKRYHLTVEDVDRILAYKPTTLPQADVLNIIKVNRLIGLRISEIMTIDKRNVVINGTCKINLREHKKTITRTVVIVEPEAIKIIADHLKNNYNDVNRNLLFHFNDRANFNRVLEYICKEVFKDEKVLIYKNTEHINNDYKEFLKYKVITSHAFRRYGISRNTAEFGIEVAKTMAGIRSYETIINHYSDYLNEEDLKKKLLSKS